MRSAPSTRAADALALRALGLTLCIPLAAVALLSAAVLVGFGHDTPLVLVMAGLIVAMPGLLTLRSSKPGDGARPGGALVDEVSEPSLVALVAAECAALKVSAPARIRVTLEHEVYMTRIAGPRTLVIGAPLVAAISEPAVRVAVAHAVLHDRPLSRWLHGWACLVLARVEVCAAVPVVGQAWGAIGRRIWPQVAAACRARAVLADAQCARRLGGAAAAAHVRAQARDDAFVAYWTGEVTPCLDAGFRPPILAGWKRFLRDPAVAEQISTTVAADLGRVPERGDPVPTAGARLAAIDAAASPDRAPGDGAIFALRSAPDALEAAALREAGASGASALVDLDWERVVDAVWLPRLRASAHAHRAALHGRTATDLPRLAQAAAAHAPGHASGAGPDLETLGAALAVALVDRGWELVTAPQGPLMAVGEDHSLLVLQVPAVLAGADEEQAGEWELFVADAGLEDLPLAGAAADRPPDGAGGTAPWPTLTVPTTLRLERTPSLRRTTIAAVAIGGSLGAALCAMMIVLAFGAPTVAAERFFVVAAPLGTLLLGLWLYSRARLAFTRGCVNISQDELRIEDRGLLSEPVVVARAQVRAVAVDDGPTESVMGHPLRFAFGRSPWLHPSEPALAATGWLWTGAHDLSVPMLGSGHEVPNLLVLFSEPLPAPRMRRRGDGLPRKHEALTGLALCVDDPLAAQRAFSGWEVVRPLSEHDAHRRAATATTGRRGLARVSRGEKRGWILVACGLIVPPVALLALADAAVLRQSAPLRARVLALTAIAVVVVRAALYAGSV